MLVCVGMCTTQSEAHSTGDEARQAGCPAESPRMEGSLEDGWPQLPTLGVLRLDCLCDQDS